MEQSRWKELLSGDFFFTACFTAETKVKESTLFTLRLSLSTSWGCFQTDTTMDEAGCLPVIVEGDWGTSVTKTVKNKLHIYFQSRKKSGGGECRVEAEDGAQGAAVFFESDEGEWSWGSKIKRDKCVKRIQIVTAKSSVRSGNLSVIVSFKGGRSLNFLFYSSIFFK